MKVSLFFDGKNFYSGWRDTGDQRRIDFVKMADWICQKVGGTFCGATYYTEEGPETLSSFLDMLSHQRGYFVKCFRKHSQVVSTSGKRTAVHIACDIMMSKSDIVVLVSGDGDLSTVLKAVRQTGRIAYVASWSGAGLSGRLRRAAFDHINLTNGINSIISPEKFGFHESAPEEATAGDIEAFLDELERAEEHFDDRYVGLSYFVTRWRSHTLTSSSEIRRHLLDRAVDTGLVEVYDAPDGSKAIRSIIKNSKEELKEEVEIEIK